jgi:hypothetical protein
MDGRLVHIVCGQWAKDPRGIWAAAMLCTPVKPNKINGGRFPASAPTCSSWQGQGGQINSTAAKGLMRASGSQGQRVEPLGLPHCTLPRLGLGTLAGGRGRAKASARCSVSSQTLARRLQGRRAFKYVRPAPLQP